MATVASNKSVGQDPLRHHPGRVARFRKGSRRL